MDSKLKIFTLCVIGLFLFSCSKSNDASIENSVENILGAELLNQINEINVVNNQLVLATIEEIKNEKVESVTYEQINERIEENATLFKSSTLNREIPVSTPVEILERYGQIFAERLVEIGNKASDEVEQTEVLELYEREKNIFINELVINTSLSVSEKKDIIVFLMIANANLITELSVYDEVEFLIKGDVQTKFIKRVWKWVKKQWNSIVNTCAFGIVSSTIGGVSYVTGVGAAVGTPLLGAGLPRLGYCFNKR